MDHSRERSLALFAALAAPHLPAADRARTRGEIVELHLPLVARCARRFRDRGEPLEDLVQVGTIGLIKAVDRFDPGRGVAFSTYAIPTIMGEIKRHFRDRGWAVKVPRRLKELRVAVATAAADLTQAHGRSPTAQEIAERLGVSVELVLEALESAQAYATVSLDAESPGDERSRALPDILGALDEALERVEVRESLRPLLESLPPRERRIVVLRFFRQMTQAQIAAEVGISQMHVSRLLARALAQLREAMA